MSDYKIGDKTTFGWVIRSSSGLNMVSDWTDYIFVNKRKDGRFSLKAYKWGENYLAPSRYVWIPVDSVIGIKTEAEFLKALNRLEESLSVECDIHDVIKVIKKIDSSMADKLQAIVDEW